MVTPQNFRRADSDSDTTMRAYTHTHTPTPPNLVVPHFLTVADDDQASLGRLDHGRSAAGLYGNPNTRKPAQELQDRVHDVTTGRGDDLPLEVCVDDLDLEPEIIRFWGGVKFACANNAELQSMSL